MKKTSLLLEDDQAEWLKNNNINVSKYMRKKVADDMQQKKEVDQHGEPI